MHNVSLKSQIWYIFLSSWFQKKILRQFNFNMNRNRKNIVNDTYISDSISKYIYGNKANHLVRSKFIYYFLSWNFDKKSWVTYILFFTNETSKKKSCKSTVNVEFKKKIRTAIKSKDLVWFFLHRIEKKINFRQHDLEIR